MLTYNVYAPPPDIAPYITSIYVMDAPLPDDAPTHTWAFAETPYVRMIIEGKWTAQNEQGEWSEFDPALLFGINDRLCPVQAKGHYKIAGFGIRACGWKALFDEACSEFNDQILPLGDFWGDISDNLWTKLKDAPDEASIVAAMEQALRDRLDMIGHRKIDQAMAITEYIARTDSTHSVEKLADRVGLSMSQFARRCRATFGLTPKCVMRRARFLDLAAAKRGLTHPSEHELAALRFFDESHMNREFKRYTGMTVRAFDNSDTPLFTAALRLRAQEHDVRAPDELIEN